MSETFWEVEVRAVAEKPAVTALAAGAKAPSATQPESYFAAEATKEAAEAHAARIAVGMSARHPDRIIETFVRAL